jgi:hypothetical protein
LPLGYRAPAKQYNETQEALRRANRNKKAETQEATQNSIENSKRDMAEKRRKANAERAESLVDA